jgi:hypothetical protein
MRFTLFSRTNRSVCARQLLVHDEERPEPVEVVHRTGPVQVVALVPDPRPDDDPVDLPVTGSAQGFARVSS